MVMLLSLRKFGLLFCVVLSLAGCANLREVNSFAVRSKQVLDKDGAAPFGYYTYFHDSAFIYHYLPDELRDVDCHCDAAKQADAHIASEFSLLSTYFATLARFADPAAEVNFIPVGAAVPAGTYGPVTISTNEAAYASRLAAGLTVLATTQYKAKKIPGFMAAYRDSVAPLIMLLKIRAENLSGRIVNLQLQLDRVADSLIHFSTDKAVRMPVLFVYERQRKELDATLAAYQQRVHDLETIIAGGQLIVDNLGDLHSKSFKDRMMSLVNALALNANGKF
jgi:hypothetical protein